MAQLDLARKKLQLLSSRAEHEKSFITSEPGYDDPTHLQGVWLHMYKGIDHIRELWLDPYT